MARLGAGELDILVVGGGVVGAGTALDAAARGMKVGLVEAQDWAAGTSSRSSKLVHGGLRYLQMLDFRLVHEGLRERALLLGRLAPHLVRPVPILYPLRRPVVDRAYVGAGVALYHFLGHSTGTGAVPRHRHLSKASALEAAPALSPKALCGAVVYHDAQVDDARFVVELVRTACALGATAVSRLAAVGFLRDGPAIAGALLQDAETGARVEARAKVTVLATGPWSEETEALAGEGRAVRVRPSKGVHLVVPGDRLGLSTGLVMPTENSVLFVLPFEGRWLVGTTDTDWTYAKGQPLATSADVAYLLSELNSVLAYPLGPADVEGVYAGLRPLVAGAGVVRGPGEGRKGGTKRPPRPKGPSAKVSREHAVASPVPGLVVVSGGKYTTYRVMAADAVDAAVADPALRYGALHWPPSATEGVPLIGARSYQGLYGRREELSTHYGVPVPAVESLVRRYGAETVSLLDLALANPALARPLPGAAGHLRAEVVFAVACEGARHLEDVLVRRCRLAISEPRAGRDSAEVVTALMGPLLGWDEAQARAEVGDYESQVELAHRSATQAHDDEEAAGWAAELRHLLPPP